MVADRPVQPALAGTTSRDSFAPGHTADHSRLQMHRHVGMLGMLHKAGQLSAHPGTAGAALSPAHTPCTAWRRV